MDLVRDVEYLSLWALRHDIPDKNFIDRKTDSLRNASLNPPYWYNASSNESLSDNGNSRDPSLSQQNLDELRIWITDDQARQDTSISLLIEDQNLRDVQSRDSLEALSKLLQDSDAARSSEIADVRDSLDALSLLFQDSHAARSSEIAGMRDSLLVLENKNRELESDLARLKRRRWLYIIPGVAAIVGAYFLPKSHDHDVPPLSPPPFPDK